MGIWYICIICICKREIKLNINAQTLMDVYEPWLYGLVRRDKLFGIILVVFISFMTTTLLLLSCWNPSDDELSLSNWWIDFCCSVILLDIRQIIFFLQCIRENLEKFMKILFSWTLILVLISSLLTLYII